MHNRKEIHDRVLNASTKEELMLAYHEWAEYYDQDLIDELSYVAPLEASRLLRSHVGQNTDRLLDAGCGTGLVGKCLREFGFTNIDGLDYSTSMLKKAKEKSQDPQTPQDKCFSLNNFGDAFDTGGSKIGIHYVIFLPHISMK